MGATSGQYAAFFIQNGTSQATTGEACTRVGATLEYYITARAKAWMDPAKTIVIYDGATPVTPAVIDYAAGMFTLSSAPAGTVTADFSYFTPVALGGVKGWDLDNTVDTKDVTVMPAVLDDPVVWKSYLACLRQWKGKCERIFFNGFASVTMDCANDNSDLVWTLKEWGTPGNLRSVEYLGGTDQTLEVSYDAGTKKFTVQCATTGTSITSTAAQIKDHVEADTVLAALVDVAYSGAQTGAGVVEAKTAALMTGGKDFSLDTARIGQKILIRHYIDGTTGALKMLSGIGWITGLPINAKLDDVQRADIEWQGEGPLKYHTV